jgi:hypothetical protein
MRGWEDGIKFIASETGCVEGGGGWKYLGSFSVSSFGVRCVSIVLVTNNSLKTSKCTYCNIFKI